jgi:hypothetical protein
MEHGLYWNCVTTCDDIKSSHHLGCQHVDHLLSENSTCLSPFPVTPSLLGQRRQTRNVRTGSSHHLIGTLCQDGLSIAVQLQMPCTMLYGWNVGIAWVLDIETHGSNSLQRWKGPCTHCKHLQTCANYIQILPKISKSFKENYTENKQKGQWRDLQDIVLLQAEQNMSKPSKPSKPFWSNGSRCCFELTWLKMT